jgi:ParB family chromosome partitioning protein
MKPALVPLSELRPGEAINPRSKGRDAGDAALVASIQARGLLQPLVVRGPERSLTAGGMEKHTYDVVDGRRRLKALIKIHGKKPIEIPVVIVDGDETSLREMALAANVVRAALHPVDEYDAYRDLIDSGLSVDDVAAHFGVKEKWVRQRLQLARLAPELRAVWRAGKMTAEQAEALSSAPDHAKQCAAWNASRDEWRRKPDQLRAALRQSAPRQDDARVKFIGLDAYLDAGGELSDDLFTETRTLTDEALLDRLADAKLLESCAAFVADGWAWAKTEAQIDRWRLRELDVAPWLTDDERAKLAKAGTWNAQQKWLALARDRAHADPVARAQSGVVVALGDDGEVDPEFLQVLPDGQAEADDDAEVEAESEGESAEAIGAGADEAAAPDAKVNWTLRETLSEQLTLAASRALGAAPDVALAALIASLSVALRSYAPSPLQLSAADAWRGVAPDRDRADEDESEPEIDWPKQFAAARTTALATQLDVLARLVAMTLDLRAPRFDRRGGWNGDRAKIVAALADALPREPFAAALAEVFDAEAYFKRVSAAACIAAIAEMDGYKAALPKKKADLVAHALGKAKACGWLPPELRTCAYTGPALKEAV